MNEYIHIAFRPVHITESEETADSYFADEMCYVYASCLFHVSSDVSFPLVVLHRFTTVAAMLGYINLKLDCAALNV